MATPLDRIKILEPRHPNRSTGIINGGTSGIRFSERYAS